MKTITETKEFFVCEICGYKKENEYFLPREKWIEIIKDCESKPIKENFYKIGDILNIHFIHYPVIWKNKYVQLKIINFKLEKRSHEWIFCFDKEVLTYHHDEYGNIWNFEIPERDFKILTEEEHKNYEIDNSLAG